MRPPFTVEQFFDVFARYNQAMWPAQWVLYALALVMIGLALRGSGRASRWVSGLLALCWTWSGLVYHLGFFSAVNAAAAFFGAAFVLEAAALFYFGTLAGDLSFRADASARSALGTLFIVYALVFYPLLGASAGHVYPETPMFGLPCPTTIFTFGLLLWTDARMPLGIVVIPAVWSLIGGSAAVSLGVPQDYGLIAAGVLGTIAIVGANRRLAPVKARQVWIF